MSASLSATTGDSSFASTRWTIVRQAADSQTSPEHALNALSELCQIYWRPVYLFLRREGVTQHNAQDLTQSFFADLIASAERPFPPARARGMSRGEQKRFMNLREVCDEPVTRAGCDCGAR